MLATFHKQGSVISFSATPIREETPSRHHRTARVERAIADVYWEQGLSACLYLTAFLDGFYNVVSETEALMSDAISYCRKATPMKMCAQC